MDIPPSIRDIDRSIPVQRRIWAASRVAWLVMAAILVLAAAGLFGEGWLASAEAEPADGSLHVAYDRFQRTDAATEITVTLRRPGDALLCFDRAFLQQWRITQVVPAPVQEEARGEDVCHLVRTGGAAGAAGGRAVVRFHVIPLRTRVAARGRLRLSDAAPATLRVLVWP